MRLSPPRAFVAALVALLAACAPREPIPVTSPGEIPGAAVVRRPADPAIAAPAPEAPSMPPLASAAPSSRSGSLPPLAGIVIPADAIYVCVGDRGGERTQTVIEFAPRVLALCRKHPEMGPCQYERNICRSSGGRVFAANGQEITAATEAEYDRKVMRVRLRSN